jgi:hypothetical protein
MDQGARCHGITPLVSILVRVLHAAKFANRQSLTGHLKFFVADIFFFASLQALGRAFVCGGNGPVLGDVFLRFSVSMYIGCYGKRSCLRKQNKG